MRAVGRHAVAQRAHEIGVGPAADAMLRIGRDVGAVERAERRLQGPPAGQRRTLRLDVGMAAGAARRGEQIGAAFERRRRFRPQRLGDRAERRDRQAQTEQRAVRGRLHRRGTMVSCGRPATPPDNTR
jgi:hypothetical protein